MSWYSRYYDDEDYYESDCGKHHEAAQDAVIVEKPTAASKRGPIATQWWGKQWVAAVESFYQDDRLARGRTYARNGSVRKIEISYGNAYARVKGSQRYAYCTEISLNPFTKAEWQQALAALGGQAIYSAKLLAGEMPSDIETVFQSGGLSLFPRNLKDIHFDCSCPDSGDPCKHAAAVYYLLAEQLDADPFVLFHLRGRTRDQVLDALRRYRSAAAGIPEDTAATVAPIQLFPLTVENFWSAPDAVLIHSAPVIPKKPPLLVQLGEAPGGIDKELRAVYRAISAEAETWLNLMNDEAEAAEDSED